MFKKNGNNLEWFNRRTGRNSHIGRANLNQMHIDYLIFRYRLIAAVAMYSGDVELTAKDVLSFLMDGDTSFR